MKILNLSIDQHIFDKDSATAKRIINYGGLVEKYTVIIPSQKSQEVTLSNKVNVYGIGGKFKTLQLFSIYRFVDGLLRKERYDLVTVQDQYYLAALGLRLAKKYEIGLEIQVHGIERCKGLRKIIAQYVLSKAEAVRTVSGRLKQRLVDLFNVAENKITVVPIYVPLKEKQEIKNYQLKKPSILLTVCRLVPIKNIELQIRALNNFKKDNVDVELWIVGSGSEEKKLKELSRALAVDDNVKFWGWQSDLDHFYKQADLFLLTSDFEGWGMVVVEAAQYGLPIVMTDVGLAGEVIINNESGLVVPIKNVKALAEAIKKILADENLRERLGKAAQQQVSKLLSREKTLAFYKSSWEKAIANTKLQK